MKNVLSKSNETIFFVLFISALGTCLFMAGSLLFLLEMGFNAATASIAVALTAVPNVLFGNLLGRLVDRSCKPKLFAILCAYLSIVEILLLKSAGWWGHASHASVVISLMIAFSFGYSPMLTLIYSYLIPSLDADESRIFTKWEKAQACAAIAGGIIAFSLLRHFSAGWIIIFDTATFLIAGVSIPLIWQPSISIEINSPPDHSVDSSQETVNIIEIIRSICSDRKLVATAIGMWTLALSVASLENNHITIGWLELKLGAAYIALSTSLFAIANLAGSYWFSSKRNQFSADLLDSQKIFLVAVAVVLMLLSFASFLDLKTISFLCLLGISFFEPATSVTTNLLVRSRIDHKRIGEVYGLIRMPRALLTILGTSLIGTANDLKIFPVIVMGTAGLLVLTAIYTRNVNRSIETENPLAVAQTKESQEAV